MNVKSKENIIFANKVCRMCFSGLFPLRVSDATIVKMVRHNVDQIELNP